MKKLFAVYEWSLNWRINFKLTILIVTSILVSHCGGKDPVSPILFGVWKTDAAQYEDRFIEISPDKLIFGTGDDFPNTYYIRGVTHKQTDNKDEYIFKCMNAETTEFSFIFYIENGENGLLMRLNNPRQVVWMKEAEPDMSMEK